jgi:hypothetical protein
MLERTRELPLPEGLLPFVATRDLWRYLKMLLALAGLPPGVEQYRYFAGIRLSSAQQATRATGEMESFLERLPGLVQQAGALVPHRAIEAFHRCAVQESATLVGDYLAGRPLQPPRGTVPLPCAVLPTCLVTWPEYHSRPQAQPCTLPASERVVSTRTCRVTRHQLPVDRSLLEERSRQS